MDELISRQAAIDAVCEYCEYCEYFYNEKVIQSIKKIPSVQPQRWIPVSEALPNDGVEVWVTIKGHDVIRCKEGETLEQAIDRINKIRWVTRGYWSEEEHGWNDPSFGCPLIVQPVAWMPIDTPEPWRGEEHETN